MMRVLLCKKVHQTDRQTQQQQRVSPSSSARTKLVTKPNKGEQDHAERVSPIPRRVKLRTGTGRRTIPGQACRQFCSLARNTVPHQITCNTANIVTNTSIINRQAATARAVIAANGDENCIRKPPPPPPAPLFPFIPPTPPPLRKRPPPPPKSTECETNDEEAAASRSPSFISFRDDTCGSEPVAILLFPAGDAFIQPPGDQSPTSTRRACYLVIQEVVSHQHPNQFPG